MASLSIEERAQQYIDWLKSDKSRRTVECIVAHMNGLVYSGNKLHITEEYKMDIVNEMERLAPKYESLLEQSDNQTILDLISLVKETIEGKK